MKKINLVCNIIINENEEILLIEKKTSNKTYPISGKLEIGEQWIDGAKREIFEETNLKAINTRYITSSTQTFTDDKIIETKWFFTSWVSGQLHSNYREGTIFWSSLEHLEAQNLLLGDKKIILDFLNDELLKHYVFTYDKNRQLIND